MCRTVRTVQRGSQEPTKLSKLSITVTFSSFCHSLRRSQPSFTSGSKVQYVTPGPVHTLPVADTSLDTEPCPAPTNGLRRSYMARYTLPTYPGGYIEVLLPSSLPVRTVNNGLFCPFLLFFSSFELLLTVFKAPFPPGEAPRGASFRTVNDSPGRLLEEPLCRQSLTGKAPRGASAGL